MRPAFTAALHIGLHRDIQSLTIDSLKTWNCVVLRRLVLFGELGACHRAT